MTTLSDDARDIIIAKLEAQLARLTAEPASGADDADAMDESGCGVVASRRTVSVEREDCS